MLTTPPNLHADHMFSDESINIHYRAPTSKLLKMNTFNEFELNRMKKLYADELESRRLQRSKSSRLPANSAPFTCKPSSSRSYTQPVAAAAGHESPVVDLNRYQRAFLSKGPAELRRGVARFGRALFDFQAKSELELSLKRGDLLEMLEILDHTWARVEDCQSGLQGLVPLNYIDYSVGCGVARRDVSGKQRVVGSSCKEAASSAALLPMNKGEPITLIRRLSGHWYEASNTRQAMGLVWSNDLDIIKQPAAQESRAAAEEEEEEEEDGEEAMLILESGERVLARRRTKSASGSRNCCKQPDCCQEECASMPRRSSSSPYIAAAAAGLPRLCRAKYSYKPRQKDELELVAGDILVVVHECDDGWFIGSSYTSKATGTFPGNFVEPI